MLELIAIGNTILKLQENGKTIVRAHAMNDGSWAVSSRGEYKEMSEDAAREIFKMKTMAEILTAMV